MAFLIQQVDGGRVPGIEYLPCGAITPKVGMALIQSGRQPGLPQEPARPPM